jgi:hypothetical protein
MGCDRFTGWSIKRLLCCQANLEEEAQLLEFSLHFLNSSLHSARRFVHFPFRQSGKLIKFYHCFPV